MNYSQYDKIASKYDTLFRDEMSLVENREVGQMLPPLSGSILDIGCGTGLLTEIAEIDPKEYLGIDPVKECWSSSLTNTQPIRIGLYVSLSTERV